MINTVGTLVLFVAAMTGCCAMTYELDDDGLWTPNRTLAPEIPKAVTLPLQQNLTPSTLSPVQPKVVGPPCSSDSTLEVPAGGSVTFTSPTPPTKDLMATNQMCGWDFKTVSGSTFVLTCQSFSLSGQDTFYVNGDRSSRPFVHSFRSQSFPSRLLLNAATVRVLFVYDPSGNQGYFSCTITASGGTTSTTTSTALSPISTNASAKLKAVTKCRCGIVNRTTRIVGGTNTQVNEYPWQVGLLEKTSRHVFCGGSLINDRFIVTAAHCLIGQTSSTFRVLLLGYTRDPPSANEIIVNPISIIDHEIFNKGAPGNNDIFLIKIQPLDFSRPTLRARPICLPNSAEEYVGVLATTTGWGRLFSGGVQPNILQEVNIPIVTNTYCKSIYGPKNITSSMICAGSTAESTGPCQGDSGGPLIARDGANYELIGVVSFGKECGLPKVSGVYARVSAMQPWIVSKVAGSTSCGR